MQAKSIYFVVVRFEIHTHILQMCIRKKGKKILVDIGLCLAIASVIQGCVYTSISSCDEGVAIKCSKSDPETGLVDMALL